MEMLLLSFAGSVLAYFAFLSASSSAASAQAASATNWPPTQAQQQALQTQLTQLYVEMTGQQMSATQQQYLSLTLSQAPTQYQATLPQGAQATTGGYIAWVLSGAAAHVAAGAPGSPGVPRVFPPAGYGAQAPGQGYTGPQNIQPMGASSGGPLGLRGGNPNPMWDVYGNAYFTDSRGFPVAVYHSTYPWADYSVPVHITDFLRLQQEQLQGG